MNACCEARFNDARFFWDVDQHKKLADRVADLSHVTFQAKLGSYLEKTKRVVELVEELGGDDHAQRAALLCKADLTTEMVKEFTDLQGMVGGLYARASRRTRVRLANAIYDHYKPLSMEDAIPSHARRPTCSHSPTNWTRCADASRVGLVPTGSKDPFALRRAAQGVVKILVEAKLDYKLDDLAQRRPARIPSAIASNITSAKIRGFKYDEVNARTRLRLRAPRRRGSPPHRARQPSAPPRISNPSPPASNASRTFSSKPNSNRATSSTKRCSKPDPNASSMPSSIASATPRSRNLPEALSKSPPCAPTSTFSSTRCW